MRIYAWVVLVAQQSLDIVAVFEAILRFLVRLRVLRTQTGEVTLRVVRRTVLWLPARVPRLRRLRLHRTSCLLVLVNLRLILLHMLIVVLGIVGQGSAFLLVVVLLTRAIATNIRIG